MKFIVELPEVWITEFYEKDPLCDAYWVSSLTQSWQKGYPDNCTLSWSNYVDVARRLRMHTDKPIVVDVDMMFNEPSIAAIIAKELYEVGVNTIVIESKRFPKVNSLTPNSMVLSTPDEFSRLLNKVKTTVPDLEIIARNEYLVKTKSVDETVAISKRALNSGADGVVVHWGADSNTTLLKEALKALKDEKIKTGIIPTKYLDQVVQGEFDGLADFSILGNLSSSFIRHEYSKYSISDLLRIPSMFSAILDRVSGHEPKGQRTLFVLGAVPASDGKMLLNDDDVFKRFEALSSEYYQIVFVINDQVVKRKGDKVCWVTIDTSIGEVDSLAAAGNYFNTEYSSVVYADVTSEAIENRHEKGLLFDGDTYAGIFNVKTDVLISMLKSADPTNSILNMASSSDAPVSFF